MRRLKLKHVYAFIKDDALVNDKEGGKDRFKGLRVPQRAVRSGRRGKKGVAAGRTGLIGRSYEVSSLLAPCLQRSGGCELDDAVRLRSDV